MTGSGVPVDPQPAERMRESAIYDTDSGRCDAHANLGGEDVLCELAAVHTGWQHTASTGGHIMNLAWGSV